MQKRAPTLGNIVVIILFVLSCFGLLMFLWESFGGPLPLKPKGYRIVVAFPRTLALAEQSDVRISGVDVGHVVALKLGSEGLTRATLELSSQYAPIRANMHAILRQKTLLGETYVQLIPQGDGHTGPYLQDNAQLAESQVEPSVTLDDILSAFDAKTRASFKIWQQALAAGIAGRGEQINGSLTQLEPFVENANKLVTILDRQEGAVSALVRNTGVVFNALASRDHQLEGLIVNGERTFHAAAESSQAFAEAFQALPAFEHNSRIALKEIDKFSVVANPFFEEFQPAQRQLTLLLQAAKPFVPQFNAFLTTLGPTTAAAKTDLPYLKKSLDLTTPALENLRPVLHNLDPFLQSVGEYVPELQAFFANLTAATQASASNTNVPEGEGPKQHYLSAMQVLGPESLAIYPKPIGTARTNPYHHPGSFNQLAGGLPVFSSSTCANSAPSVNGPGNETITPKTIEQIIEFGVGNLPENPNGIFTGEEEKKRRAEIEQEQAAHGGNLVKTPGCNQQGPFSFNGQVSQFPHVVYGGK